MNLQRLRTFFIAGEAESLTAAAEQLRYAQSTVTQHIQLLEAEWGVKLFRKDGRGVRLTPEGRTLLAKVRTVIWQLNALDQAVVGIEQGGAGHLRIGVMEPAGSWKVAPLLAEHSRTRPLLQINLETGSSYSLCHRLLHHELEVVVMHRPNNDQGLEFEPLFSERNGILLRADDPLAHKATLSLEDLRTKRLVFQDTVVAYHGILENELVYYGRGHPYANLELNSIGAMVRFVQQGIGWAVLPAYCVDPLPAGCVLRFVEGHYFERHIGILYVSTKQRPLVADEVLELLRTHLKQR